MHVEHVSLQAREHRQRRVADAEKRRQFRVAHGMEDGRFFELSNNSTSNSDAAAVTGEIEGGGEEVSQSQSQSQAKEKAQPVQEEYVDWEGNRTPVKKWFGLW